MAVTAAEIPVLASIKELGSRYRAWLVDIWGVMHNGHRAFPAAVAATHRGTRALHGGKSGPYNAHMPAISPREPGRRHTCFAPAAAHPRDQRQLEPPTA